MRLKKWNIEKELKKVQKKGIYNPKIKIGIMFMSAILITIIGSSMAYYTYSSGEYQAYNSTVGKKVTVTLSASNGYVNGESSKSTESGGSVNFSVSANTYYEYSSLSCTGGSYSYSSGTVTVQNVTSDTSCTITFRRKQIRIYLYATNGTINGSQSTSKTGDAGGTITFTSVYPNNNYKYEDAYCESASISYSNSTNKVTITNATTSQNCYITFKAITLKDKILANNSIINKTPNFSIGEPPVTGSNSGSGMYEMDDDDGPSYYFRGNVTNNYVDFAGYTWRILRINGDGTIRLIKQDSIGVTPYNNFTDFDLKYVGYTYDTGKGCTKSDPCRSEFDGNTFSNNRGTNGAIKTQLEKWYINSNLKKSEYNNNIEYGKFINDTSVCEVSGPIIYYNSNCRVYDLSSPSLKSINPTNIEGNTLSYGGIYRLKIGIITYDELIMLGYGKWQHLPDTEPYASPENWFYKTDEEQLWTMSPHVVFTDSNEIHVFGGRLGYGMSNTDEIRGSKNLYPVINLKADIPYSAGDGKFGSPYEVK